MTTHETFVASPLGPLCLRSDGQALTGLYMERHLYQPPRGAGWRADDDLPVFSAAREQLAAYFAGTLRAFDLPLALAGTPFQRRVWAELLRIPHGEVTTYAALARRVGSTARPVGHANGHNPVSIIVPCHRVVGSGGELKGYGGGLPRKEALLALEGLGLHELRALAAATPG